TFTDLQSRSRPSSHFALFFSNNTTPPAIYTLSLHDALPISRERRMAAQVHFHCRREPAQAVRVVLGMEECGLGEVHLLHPEDDADRKSTRLNSSHDQISYAVFCLKKKKNK